MARRINSVSMPPTCASEWRAQNWRRLAVAPEAMVRWGRGDADAPRLAGVYFLWHCGELQYVGHSGDILYRMAQHQWGCRIPFDSFSMVEIDCDPFEYGLVAPYIERAYISALVPPHNSSIPPRDRAGMADEVARLWRITPATAPATAPA